MDYVVLDGQAPRTPHPGIESSTRAVSEKGSCSDFRPAAIHEQHDYPGLRTQWKDWKPDLTEFRTVLVQIHMPRMGATEPPHTRPLPCKRWSPGMGCRGGRNNT